MPGKVTTNKGDIILKLDKFLTQKCLPPDIHKWHEKHLLTVGNT